MPEHIPTLQARQSNPCPYVFKRNGIFLRRLLKGDVVDEMLANFQAKIVADILIDDGLETNRVFELETILSGEKRRFRVAPAAFEEMSWVLDQVGPKAIVIPKYQAREHLRAAIQFCSGKIEHLRLYGHTGWVLHEGQHVYLHAGGAVQGLSGGRRAHAMPERPSANPVTNNDLTGGGPVGPVSGEGQYSSCLKALLPDSLSDFRFPDRTCDIRDVVVDTTLFLKLGTPRIVYPLFSAIWRSILGNTRFGLHVAGFTGSFKTETAALVQQFFGRTMDAGNLKGHWAGTANSLEALAFLIKDGPLVVDDFATSGTRGDVQRLNQTAERLFRASANAGGRSRSTSTGSFRPPRQPRALIISTGEDIPTGHSLRARFLTLAMGPADIDQRILGICQRLAAAGVFAEAMAGFIEWVAPRFEDIQSELRCDQQSWRTEALVPGLHRRIRDTARELEFGFCMFTRFAVEVGAMSEGQARAMELQCWEALTELAFLQQQHVEFGNPVEQFQFLLTALLGSKFAHLASLNGESFPEESPEAWGYRKRIDAAPGKDTEGNATAEIRITWQAMGIHIGWIDSAHVYLNPEVAFATVQSLGTRIGTPIPLTIPTLEKRMMEQGLVVGDEKRNRVRRRITADGARRYVLTLPKHKVLWLASLGPDPENEKEDSELNEQDWNNLLEA